MKRTRGILNRLSILCVAVVALLAMTGNALADKLHLKDGRTLEGTITSETKDYVYFTLKVGGIEHTDIFLMSDIKEIERDSITNPTPAPAGTTAPGAASKNSKNDGVHRICILNFGPPSVWGGQYDDMVGLEVSAAAFERALPVMKRDGVTDVVIRINSGGGALLEIEKFHAVFEKYKQNFRTVCWVESAISAAAMSPWVIEEFYMMPNGSIGACTGWSGNLVAVKGVDLAEVLLMMEKASKKANRNPAIMRSMQILEPLSVTIDPVTGKVTWYQDESSGTDLVNPKDHILTFNAADAVKYKFAKAIALSKEELAEAMLGPGVEYVWAGREASELVDNSIRTNDKANKEAIEVVVKYVRAIAAATQLQDPQERGAEVGRARKMLNQLEAWVKQNPNLEFFLAQYAGALLSREWFTIQRELLRDLMR